jgi:hypothetical protein
MALVGALAFAGCTTVVVQQPEVDRALAASMEARRVDALADRILNFRDGVLADGNHLGQVDRAGRAAAARASLNALREETATVHRARLDVEGRVDLDLCILLLDAAAADLALADAADARLLASGALPAGLSVLAIPTPDAGLRSRLAAACALEIPAEAPATNLSASDLGHLVARARHGRDLAQHRGREVDILYRDGALRASADAFAARLEARANVLDEARKARAHAKDLPPTVGRAMFEVLLRTRHGVDSSPEDVRAFGVALLDETTRELEALAKAQFPGLTWKEALEKVRDDHASAEALPAEAFAAALEARDFCIARGIVTIPAQAALARVELVDDEMARTYPFAAFSFRAATEEGEAGRYMVSAGATWMDDAQRLQRLRGNCRAWTSVVAPHEAWPGHHLQFWYSDRYASRLRRTASTAVLVEGWGHYCEGLLDRHGFFRTPDQRLALLVMRAWRAARVVLDVAIHCDSMSYEDAVATLRDRAALSADAAEAEVRRYFGAPTQPFTYAWGRGELERLRADVERRDGPAFDERAFHDRLLRAGPIPTGYLRRLFRLEE